jgi:hypothetical protein
VTLTDHELKRFSNDRLPTDPLDIVGLGLSGDPGSSFSHAVPGTQTQSAADRQLSGMRVTFTNLSEANNRIKIYTVSGDLVQTISHGGLDGTGHVSWNLMSRNGQEIVSGVYLYSVQSDDSRFEDFVGKFVVVR